MTFSTHTVPAPASHQPIPGLTSIGIQLPPEAVDVPALAPLRGAEPDKYRLGLGCLEMAFCPEGYGIVDLAAGAARRALGRWGGDPARIGLLAVGTETAVDMSRPLSAWVAEELGLSGALRSYEVKHACYGGTLALRQAAEWTASGAGRGKAALVIAADIALYEPGDPGEPTQGAGAVAFVVEDVSAGSDTAVDRACIATLGIDSYAYSEPAFDFWRPVGHSFPSVDGAFSLKCYQKAAEECFRQWQNGRPGHDALATLDAACFHVPFPKMVKKAVVHVGEALGWGDAATTDFFDGRVDPSMVWNRRVGNAYTASLWISVAHALLGRPEGREIAAFSYGSGFGSELFTLTTGPGAERGAWADDIEADFTTRRRLSAADYVARREKARRAA